MTDTLVKVDLSKPATSNEGIHNRWHPDIPFVATVKPGADFILETYDWTGGFIKDNDSADDVRDIDLTTVHYLSGPIGVEGAEPGDLLVVEILDIGVFENNSWGFNGIFARQNGGGFLVDHFPDAHKSIWGHQGHVHLVPARPRGAFRRSDPSRSDRLFAVARPCWRRGISANSISSRRIPPACRRWRCRRRPARRIWGK